MSSLLDDDEDDDDDDDDNVDRKLDFERRSSFPRKSSLSLFVLLFVFFNSSASP